MQLIIYAEWAFVAILLAGATVFTLWSECKSYVSVLSLFPICIADNTGRGS